MKTDVKVGDVVYIVLDGGGEVSPYGGRRGNRNSDARCEWVTVYYVGEHFVTVEVMRGYTRWGDARKYRVAYTWDDLLKRIMLAKEYTKRGA